MEEEEDIIGVIEIISKKLSNYLFILEFYYKDEFFIYLLIQLKF